MVFGGGSRGGGGVSKDVSEAGRAGQGDPSAPKKPAPQDDKSFYGLALRLRRFFLPHALAHLELHLAGLLVGVDLYVVAVQNFAVENFHRQRILHQLLNGSLQRTRSEVGVVALREQQLFGRIGELD
jgi:hypothetical protein